MMSGWIETVAEAETLITFFMAIIFVAIYSLLASWWKHSIGITIAMLDIVIAMTLLPSTLHLLFGFHVITNVHWSYFTLSVFALVPMIILWRIIIFWRIKQRGGEIK